MPVSPEFVDHVLDLLSPTIRASARRMFGGQGLYAHGVMFAILADDTLYLKSDESSRPSFEARGMGPFTYRRREKLVALASYYEAPAEAFDDSESMAHWALPALQAALRASAVKKPASRVRRSSTLRR